MSKLKRANISSHHSWSGTGMSPETFFGLQHDVNRDIKPESLPLPNSGSSLDDMSTTGTKGV